MRDDQPIGEDFIPQPWHELYFRAWDDLRFDRHYGAMGGEMPISYSVLSKYARDIGLLGADFRMFLTFMAVLDATHLEQVTARTETQIFQNAAK